MTPRDVWKCRRIGWSLLCTGSTFIAIHPVLAQQSSSDVALERRAESSSAVFGRLVTVTLDGVSLKAAVKQVAARAGVRVTYQDATLDVARTLVTIHAQRQSLSAIFSMVLQGTGLKAVALGPDFIGIQSGDGGTLTDGTVRGSVVDARTKLPISGAIVSVSGHERGVQTDAKGAFQLSAPAGQTILSIRRIGYVRTSRTVQVEDGQGTDLSVELTPSTNQLEQVVVTGTVIPTELKAVPNAITVITAKQLEERGITRIDQLFRGDVPGLFSVNQGTQSVDGQVVMFSRGATALDISSLGGSLANGTDAMTNAIKTYVDGVELANPRYLSQIDPKSIERIEILTGPQASTIYGSNAINGVMQIFTKRGTSSVPQLTLNLLSGWVENNFSSAHTPQHDYSAQANGVEGRFSYNLGSTWNYMGRWSPSSQRSSLTGFGGTHFEMPTHMGRVLSDVSLRRTQSQNLRRGSQTQSYAALYSSGWWLLPASTVSFYNGVAAPLTTTIAGQTLGFSLSYAPTVWWSHEIGLGSDVSDTEYRSTARGYATLSDTNLTFNQAHSDRRSIRYVSSVRVPVTSLAQLSVTLGGDRWKSLGSYVSANAQTLTGTVTTNGFIMRTPAHDGGAFLQTQLGIADALFLTYGLRAEWNPDYGADAQPNLAPRVGAAFTHEIGALTAKVRASYGRSTRPPSRGLKVGQTIAEYLGTDWLHFAPQILPYYGKSFDYTLANPGLGPEFQAGGEGGLELYFGTRGSLVVTRYNQTVDDLISTPIVDSIRTLIPCGLDDPPECDAWSYDSQGYGYWSQYQSVNLGSIRNEGWELQGNAVLGPLTAHATYSWTKSRILGVKPQYRAYFANNARYQPGASFNYLPEHTWAAGVTYSRGGSNISVNLTGLGRVTNFGGVAGLIYSPFVRLMQNLPRTIGGIAVRENAAYAMADLNATHRFAGHIDGIFEVHNLEDKYVNDYSAAYVTMGRQVKAGLRIRTP